MFIKNCFLKRKKKKYIKITRGYEILKASSQLNLLDNLKFQLTNSELNSKIHFSKFIRIDSTKISLEVCIKQFILQRFIGIDFNNAVLISIYNNKEKFIFPLPREWQDILVKNGFKVQSNKCNILWKFEMLKLWGYAFYELIRQTIYSLVLLLKNRNKKIEKFIYFDSLNESNLPKRNGHSQYGILSWYYNHSNIKDVKCYAHSVNSINKTTVHNIIDVIYFKSPIYPPLSLKKLYKFFILSFYKLFVSLFSLFTGKWWSVILLRDSFLSSIIKLNNSKGIAEKYLFNNSTWIYRPIWTYTAEMYNSEIYFYFYSTNIERFKKENENSIIANSWNIISWSNYYVWDNYQKNFIQKVSNYPSNIFITGPINFVFSEEIEIIIPENSIAIFDVQPVRSTYYNSLGLDQEYYIPEIAFNFLNDVYNTVSLTKFQMIFKKKRNIGKLSHYKYSKFIDKFSEKDNFINIDASIPAELIIERVKAVISMPFTSTSLLGINHNIPSIFYDPTKTLLKDDPAAHGIQIINNKSDLKNWINKLK